MNLLKINSPTIIGSSIFSTKNVRKNINFNPVGIISKYKFHENKKYSSNNLLFSIGASNNSIDNFEYFFGEHLNLLKKSFRKIYCDPILIKKFNFDNSLIEANYSSEMYKDIDFAIVRPGLGTVTDLLSHKCIPICIYENNNEMINNASLIENSKIGFDYGILNENNKDLKDIISFIKFNANQLKKNIEKLNFNGLNETVDIIKRVIYKKGTIL